MADVINLAEWRAARRPPSGSVFNVPRQVSGTRLAGLGPDRQKGTTLPCWRVAVVHDPDGDRIIIVDAAGVEIPPTQWTPTQRQYWTRVVDARDEIQP